MESLYTKPAPYDFLNLYGACITGKYCASKIGRKV